MSTPEGVIGAGENAGSIADLSSMFGSDVMSTILGADAVSAAIPPPAAPPAPVTPAAAPPTPAPAAADAANAGTAGAAPATGDAAPPAADPAAAAAEAAATGDAPTPAADANAPDNLELSETELIDKIENQDLRAKMKHGSLAKLVKDVTQPIDKVVEQMHKLSAPRAAEIESHIIAKHLGDPNKFAPEYFAANPEGYSALAKAVFKGDPATFARMLTGGKAESAQQIVDALEFQANYKDRVGELPDDTKVLDDDEMAQFEDLFPDKVDGIRALQTQAARAKQLEAQLKEKEAAAPAGEPVKSAEQQNHETHFNDLRDTIGGDVMQWAKDPQGLNLNVTDAERTSAPLVAMLKDLKMSILTEGLTVAGKEIYPVFDQGFIQWGENKPEFKELFTNADYYARKGDTANFAEAKRGLNALQREYRTERLKAPIFSLLDQALTLIANQPKPSAPVDTSVSGGMPSAGRAAGANTPSPGTTGNWLVEDAVARVAT